MALRWRYFVSAYQRSTAATKRLTRRIANLFPRIWRAAVFLTAAIIATGIGFALKPNNAEAPQPRQDTVVVLVNRANVRGLILIGIGEDPNQPGGPTIGIFPYLSADDGKPVQVTVITDLTEGIKHTGYKVRLLKSRSGVKETLFYGVTAYPKASVISLMKADTIDQISYLSRQQFGNAPVAAISGRFAEDSDQNPDSSSNFVVSRGSWVNVSAVTVLAGPLPGTNAPGLGEMYAPYLDVWENISGIPTSELQLAASEGNAPATAPNQIYWHVRNSETFAASATYVDLAKQDEAHSSEFLAGIFIGIAGAAFIAFIQELPRKESRNKPNTSEERAKPQR